MLARHTHGTYARASASGGGLYPVDAYIVSRSCSSLPPGVYHYDVAHHELVRVRMGNFETVTRSALNFPQVDSADLFVVLAARFWKSLFKYKDLTYQLVMQDAGASMGSIEVVAYALGWDATIVYWFQDALLCSLLGMDMGCEVPLAVFAMKKSPCKIHTSNYRRLENSGKKHLTSIHAQIYKQPRDCSLPPLLRQIHEEMLLDSVLRPALPSSLQDELALARSGSGRFVSGDLISMFCERETSWGQFRREPPLEANSLHQILSFMTQGVQYQTDVFGSHTALVCVRISLILRSVKGMADGVYSYRPSSSELSLENTAGIPESLQSIYFLNNHNVDQVPVVLIVVGKLEAALEIFGSRAVRLLNAEAGILAERAYLASTGLSLGCAAVLGFDAQRIRSITAIDGVAEIPLLLIFLGRRTSKARACDFRLI
jgi:SagB-type dehydrogenase family enzyme